MYLKWRYRFQSKAYQVVSRMSLRALHERIIFDWDKKGNSLKEYSEITTKFVAKCLNDDFQFADFSICFYKIAFWKYGRWLVKTGLARLGGISLDLKGALGQPGLNLSM